MNSVRIVMKSLNIVMTSIRKVWEYFVNNLNMSRNDMSAVMNILV